MADNITDSRYTTDAVDITADGMRHMKLEDGVVDDVRQQQLNKLRDQKHYENVFSWDMRNASKMSENMIIEFKTNGEIRKSFERQFEMAMCENRMELFSLYMYRTKLILCYEYFTNEKYDDSLLEVEDLVNYMNTVTFDKSNEQYINAYNHMVYSTYAFISISMNRNNSYEEIMKNLKLRSELNDIEKSAVHAVKALVFIKYPALSKKITFNEAAEAYKLNSTSADWIHIWLKAKGHLNREFSNFVEPDIIELKMAEHLLSISKSFWHLIAVIDVFLKVSKLTNEKQKKEKYLKLTFENMSMAMEVAGNNECQIIKCLKLAIDQPIPLLSNSIIEEKIEILHNFKHPDLNYLFGNYYLKLEDYNTAKDYFIRGKETDVSCVLKMLTVECILKPLDEIPIIEILSEAYNIFTNSKSRVKFVSQILFFYTYFKEEQNELIYYFKLFMDLPFNNAFKYRHLISIIPIFKLGYIPGDKFVKDLFNKVEYLIKNQICNSEEQNDLNNALQRFSKMVTEALNNTYLKQLGLNHLNVDVQAKLIDIINNYESIFSWNIKQLTGNNRNLMINLVDKIREKLAKCSAKDDDFNEYRFYYQLIICYELYTGGSYNDSLKEIESIVKHMQTCKFSESDEQYSDGYNHIAQTTYGFIALTLNPDFKMEDIKPANSLNQVQRAAICAIKARVFLEYSPKGNDIALKFAEQARSLYSTEPEYIAIWLKAKGRVRRQTHTCSMPDIDELNAAELFCSYENPSLLIQASNIYSETANFYKHKNMYEQSNNYYEISSNIILKTLEFVKEDIKYLPWCLLTYVEYPTEFLSNSVIENLVEKLSGIKDNSCLNQALGIYYFKHKKDYEKAKIYLSRGVASGSFRCALQLIKVECLLQPVNKYPLVQTLNMIYDCFPSPERRLLILSQILMFYYYYDTENRTSIMENLKLYLDQDVDDIIKKRYLINAYPNFKVIDFKKNSFLDILHLKMKNYLNLSIEEEKTFERFEEISKLNLNENQFTNNSKTVVHKQNDCDNSILKQRYYSDRKSYNNRNNECNWRKQSNYEQSSSTNINRNDEHGTNITNKLSWRNPRDRSYNQSEHTPGKMSWRVRQNKN